MPDGLETLELVPPELDSAINSSAPEHVLEHIFLADLLQEAWFARNGIIDILHTSVDASGCDVVLELGGVTRHVQLKARSRDGKRTRYAINPLLGQPPSGCMVWLGWECRGTDRIDLEYCWFGGIPGEPLPDLGDVVAEHTKGAASGQKKERADLQVLTLARFEKLDGVGELLDRFLGEGA